jgi:hypothetical protein
MRVMLTSPTLEREHTMTKREAKAEVIDLKRTVGAGWGFRAN